MNIYADRGNLLVLERRCRWRGVGFRLTASRLGEELDADGADLYYIGGGQDRDQRLCALDLYERKRSALHAAAARGAVILGVCGGYQLLGRSYQLGAETLPGAELLPAYTVRAAGPRLIGNVAIEVELEPGRRGVLAGFENHGGRTYLEAPTLALGRVLRGYGNNGSDALEGARAGSVIGTYLHGPLLPKNAWFADWLIQMALRLPEPLAPLEDSLERAAHAAACRAAGVGSGSGRRGAGVPPAPGRRARALAPLLRAHGGRVALRGRRRHGQ
jgi:CobQ-like glutamine amidotransferase family enzyme